MTIRRPPTTDIALALGLALWGVVEALALDGPGTRPERVAWALAFTLPIAWRRHVPVHLAVGLAGLAMLRVAVAQGDTAEQGAMPFPAILVLTYSAAVHARTTRLAVLAGIATYAALVVVIFLSYYTGTAEPSDAVILSFFVGAAWAAGWFVRSRIAGGEVAAREAVLEERARISRELHDIIGHSVSVISLQAGAAEQLLRTDPDAALVHLRHVQDVAREALVETRRLMGVLREDDVGYAPQPGLEALDALADQARAGGLRVEIVHAGERNGVAPGVDLAAYRIVQEALTNARKHAGAVRVQVRVAYVPGAIDLEVVNDAGSGGPGGGAGRGLAGMRERVRLFGGTLEAGDDGRGGFRVHARLPLEARP